MPACLVGYKGSNPLRIARLNALLVQRIEYDATNVMMGVRFSHRVPNKERLVHIEVIMLDCLSGQRGSNPLRVARLKY